MQAKDRWQKIDLEHFVGVLSDIDLIDSEVELDHTKDSVLFVGICGQGIDHYRFWVDAGGAIYAQNLYHF